MQLFVYVGLPNPVQTPHRPSEWYCISNTYLFEIAFPRSILPFLAISVVLNATELGKAPGTLDAWLHTANRLDANQYSHGWMDGWMDCNQHCTGTTHTPILGSTPLCAVTLPTFVLL